MRTVKQYLPLAIRVLISFLFFLSAVAKLYPNPSYALTYFEVHQLEPLGIPLNYAHYLSRTLIGVEFAIGFLLLFPFHLKKVVIPATIGMLFVFVVELLLEIIYSGNSGNCGCFGKLIEMTPLEALIKNVISIGLLFLYYYLDKKQTNNSSVLDENQGVGYQKNKYKSSFQHSAIVNTLLLCILGVFLAGPIRFQKEEPASIPLEVQPQEVVAVNAVDTVKTILPKKDSVVNVVKVDLGPKAKQSGFSNIFVDIDQDKKILCFFSPSCDHCRAAAKELTEMKAKNKNMPPIRIIFMDEGPEEIPDFFKFAGAEYPFYVMDIITFWKKIGKNNDVPGVMYLWNGNVKKFYQGIDSEKFNGPGFKKIINKK